MKWKHGVTDLLVAEGKAIRPGSFKGVKGPMTEYPAELVSKDFYNTVVGSDIVLMHTSQVSALMPWAGKPVGKVIDTALAADNELFVKYIVYEPVIYDFIQNKQLHLSVETELITRPIGVNSFRATSGRIARIALVPTPACDDCRTTQSKTVHLAACDVTKEQHEITILTELSVEKPSGDEEVKIKASHHWFTEERSKSDMSEENTSGISPEKFEKLSEAVAGIVTHLGMDKPKSEGVTKEQIAETVAVAMEGIKTHLSEQIDPLRKQQEKAVQDAADKEINDLKGGVLKLHKEFDFETALADAGTNHCAITNRLKGVAMGLALAMKTQLAAGEGGDNIPTNPPAPETHTSNITVKVGDKKEKLSKDNFREFEKSIGLQMGLTENAPT